MSGRLLVHFGAGSIGRSLVGPMFTAAGFRVVFVDSQVDIIDALNCRGRYTVCLKGEREQQLHISGISGILAGDEERLCTALAVADICSTAVGAAALPHVVKAIARATAGRARPLPVLLCENLRNAASRCTDWMGYSSCVKFVETSIGKMVPLMPEHVRGADILEVWGEPYSTIIADGDALRSVAGSAFDGIEGLALKPDFAAWVDRKLFIHNLGHAACAWHGALAGYRLIADAIADQTIRDEVESVMLESCRALSLEYEDVLAIDDLNEHCDDLRQRFGNRSLGDTVFRVGRDLRRKLSANDRAIGALRLCMKHRLPVVHICRAIAAGLLFKASDENGHYEPDRELLGHVFHKGIEATLQEICHLDSRRDAAAVRQIVRAYECFDAPA